jgi:hypothetical protein
MLFQKTILSGRLNTFEAAGHVVAGFALIVLSSTGAFGSSLSSKTSPGAYSRAGWPLFFEAGPVQNDGSTSFVARGQNYQLVLAPSEVNFILRTPELAPTEGSVRREESMRIRSASARVVRMAFAGANPVASISGAEEMEGKVNYLVGNDPDKWRAQVAIFAKVNVRALYPGIDLLYYGNHQQLEYDFSISPKADADAISIHYDGVDQLTVGPEGELIVRLGGAELRQHAPVVYQMVRGLRREIAGSYRLKDSRTVGFALGAYDHDLTLIIDPVFSYSTYFGGNGGDTGLAIKVDGGGSVYLAGETLSTQFPAAIGTMPFQPQPHGGTVTGDAFVAKLDSTGTRLLYFTYLGGSGDDGAYDLAVDANGNAYITGFTVSPDFPMHNALFSQISGTADVTFNLYPVEAFVTELNINGSALIFSTYLGGTGNDTGSAIAVDPAGNSYVTGYTYSTNFPVRNAFQSSLKGNDDVFVAKFAPGGQRLVYSTYFGGRGIDEGEGIAADAEGFAYVAGYTTSTNFPITANAAQDSLNSSGVGITVYDAFVSKISPTGQGLVYSTYLGGSQNDFGYRIAVDSSGNAYVTGTTQSPNFPSTNRLNLAFGENGTNAINFDAFFTKFDVSGQLASSTQFGGNANDAGWDVAVDPSGRAFVVGITLSTNFPVVAPFDLFRSTNSGGKDVFVLAVETNGASVLYSAYLGGLADDYGYALAVDSEANAYISGMTLSGSFPTTTAAFRRSRSGSSDAFVAKIRLMDPLLAIENVGSTLLLSWPSTAPDYVFQSTPDLSPQVWTTVPQTPVLTNGKYLLSLDVTNASSLFRLSRQ